MGLDQPHPKAFLSHSSLDKDRLVRRLDEMLRAKGIDVWLDERDLLPGTNLVDQIFTRGITASDIFIVVLSKNSIESRWVHEELSVAIVQKIAGVVKAIIPVVIDGVTPPDALLATVWERIPDLERLDLHVERIAATVFGAAPAPVAPPPAYAGVPVHRIGSLTADDERVFSAACASLIAEGESFPYVHLGMNEQSLVALGMPEDRFWESVAALESSYYFTDVRHYIGEGRPQFAKVPTHAFESYLEAYRPTQYRAEKTAILSSIVNEGADHSRAIATSLGIHEYIVEHVLTQLESGGHIQAVRAMDGTHFRTKPTVARVLRTLADEA